MKAKTFFGVLGGISLAGTAAAAIGAKTLFDRVIPRQDTLRVDMNEMADMQKWEEYKKIITPRKEWLMEQPLEQIDITAGDGIRLRGYYLPAAQPSDRLVIGLHGYTSSGLSNFSPHSYFFHQQGFDCLIVDARAHGESGGKYIGFGVLDRFDCLAWINYVEKRFGGEKRIILHGTSMGATTALMTLGFSSLPDSVKGVISDCAFTSPYDVFVHILKRDYHLPPFPIMQFNSILCKSKAGYSFDEYSTLTALKQTDRPVLFIHGAEDNFVPVPMSFENAEACRSPHELLIVDGAGHGASYYENMYLYEYTEWSFIEKYIGNGEQVTEYSFKSTQNDLL